MQTTKTLSGPPPLQSSWLERLVSSYAVRTLLQALLTIWAVVTFTFFLVRLMPGNPIDVYVAFLINQSNLTYNEALQQAASQFSFDPDASVFQQYLGYLGDLVRGDLGTSITSTGTQVIDQIARFLPWTLFCVGLGLLISFVVGMILGMIVAYYRNSVLDTVVSFFAAVLGAVPDYIWGLLILVIFGVQLGWFNIGELRGTYDPGLTPGFTPVFIWSVLQHAFLPVLVYVVGTLGGWTLNMRSSTISVLGEDYVNVARARGLPPGRVAGTYVGRNAALPLFTLLAINIGLVIGGSVIIEELFVYKGIGSFLFFSISQRDYTSMQGVFLVIAVSVVVANILADLLYSRLDPRVRVEGEALMRFFRALARTKAGLIGFVGLLLYALLVFVGPLFVPFDDEVKTDQVNAPPGSRLQLVTRAADAERYTTLAALAGRVVGYVSSSGGEALVEPLEDTFDDTENYRRGAGVEDGLEELVEGDVDALVLFSESLKTYPIGPGSDFADLAVANARLAAPHLLGTDTQGRDILSHIVNGGRTLIATALLAGLISTAIAVLLGALAALVGGPVDRGLSALANFILVLPRFPLLVVLAALFTLDNIVLLATLIGLLVWPALMRAVRAQVLSLRERDYVEAARALDLGRRHIITREILPNMMSFVLINLILAVTFAMYDQIGLIFLGMAPINDYSWGVMLYFGRTRGALFSPDSAAMVLAPVAAIALFQVSMVMFARALEEVFDPRLRAA